MFSSRKIARKLHEDVAFRGLAAGNFPKHRTLCDFRALHLDELASYFQLPRHFVRLELSDCTCSGAPTGRAGNATLELG